MGICLDALIPLTPLPPPCRSGIKRGAAHLYVEADVEADDEADVEADVEADDEADDEADYEADVEADEEADLTEQAVADMEAAEAAAAFDAVKSSDLVRAVFNKHKHLGGIMVTMHQYKVALCATALLQSTLAAASNVHETTWVPIRDILALAVLWGAANPTDCGKKVLWGPKEFRTTHNNPTDYCKKAELMTNNPTAAGMWTVTEKGMALAKLLVAS